MKKYIAALLILLLTLSMFSCSTNTNANEEGVISNERVEGSIASAYAVAVPFIKVLELSENVVAINCKSRIWTDNDIYLDNAGSIGRGVIDIENLANLNPKVVIHRQGDEKAKSAIENLNIEVLTISVETMDDFFVTLDLLGKRFGKEERAEEVKTWVESKFTHIDQIVSSIPVEERKTVIFMGGELGRVAGSDMLQNWMVEKAGGISLIDESANHEWINIGVEKIFDANPEVLISTSSTVLDYSIKDLGEDSAWQNISAVKSNSLYQMPATIDSWDVPGLSSVLGMYWMINTLYPEYFSIEELKSEVTQYYEFMFKKEFKEIDFYMPLEY